MAKNWLQKSIEAANKANGTNLPIDSTEAEFVDYMEGRVDESAEDGDGDETAPIEKVGTDNLQMMVTATVKSSLDGLNLVEKVSESVNKVVGGKVDALEATVKALATKVDTNQTEALKAVNDAKLGVTESGSGNAAPAVKETERKSNERKPLEIQGSSLNDLATGANLGGL